MRIGIVGAELSKWKPEQQEKAMDIIRALLHNHNSDKDYLVSGHCPKGGVDIWAEDYAKSAGILMNIRLPKYNRWEPEGYKARNIEIAEYSDILHVISPKGVWNGGKWTGQYAEKIGKDVVYWEIP